MSEALKASDEEVLQVLREAFDENYEILRVEAGRGLAPDERKSAWDQVRLYWKKLAEIALSITETEVRLTLPNQRTPKKRPYAIEGIVDIVRGGGATTMYDIKSHDAEVIRRDDRPYREQLNVYAHIWHALRGEPLDETAIIATRFPRDVADALALKDERKLAHALARWNPVIPMELDATRVGETVEEFGRVVDSIVDGELGPPSAEELERQPAGERAPFVSAVCRNCDARFSCSSFRKWALASGHRVERRLREYFADVGPEDEAEDRREANLAEMPEAVELTERIA